MHALLLLALIASPMDGVKTIAAPGSPGNVVMWKPGQPLVVDKDGRVMVGAVETGAGRIIAIGHNGFLGSYKTGDSGKFLQQSVDWLAFGKASKVICSHGELAGILKGQSGWPDWKGGRGEVAVVDAHQVKPKDVPAIQSYVRGGGGLLIAATGWGWQQGSGLSMDQFEANKALAPFGIGFGDGFLEKDAGGLDATRKAKPESGGDFAMKVLNGAPGDGPLAVQTLTDIMGVLPANDSWLGNATKGEQAMISAKDPVRKQQFRERFAAAHLQHQIRTGKWKGEAASARMFPGLIDTAKRPSSAEFTIRAGETRWQSTGLYAPAGGTIKITLPAGMKANLRIGAHKDKLWHLDRWERFPEITQEWPIAGTGEFANPFGGLIYLVIDQPLTTSQRVKIEGAYPALHYVLGRTTTSDWQRQLLMNPAPWAEIESDHIVVTVPRASAEKITDPTSAAKFWDKMANAVADLAQVPHWRGFKERFVADQQISAGYMHSGYPMMTWLDVADLVVDGERLQKEGSWGHYHEIGHNHQKGDWTFDGTGEVTNNLFTLYCFDKLNGFRPKDRQFTPDDCLKRYREFAKAPSFDKWKNDPFLALTMYAQLQNEFGWDAYKRVFKTYHTLKARPKNDAEKRDIWMVTFSQAVGKDLGQFFDKWHVPVSAKAKSEIASLPDWMPEGM
ncbi:MAG: hypothetical protein JNK63_10745 [Chthonomonas sp.]|nr:hypothetical protein [Chthonomonas sp.]